MAVSNESSGMGGLEPTPQLRPQRPEPQSAGAANPSVTNGANTSDRRSQTLFMERNSSEMLSKQQAENYWLFVRHWFDYRDAIMERACGAWWNARFKGIDYPPPWIKLPAELRVESTRGGEPQD